MPDSAEKRRLIAKLGLATVALLMPMVAQLEGTVLRTYRDPVGILTSCTGHTGPELRLGQRWTMAQCEQQLTADLLAHAAALDCIHRPLPDGARAAFVSFAYNVGTRRFCESGVARLANAGDLAGACEYLTRYVYATGVRLPGLVRRRAMEREVCLS